MNERGPERSPSSNKPMPPSSSSRLTRSITACDGREAYSLVQPQPQRQPRGRKQQGGDDRKHSPEPQHQDEQQQDRKPPPQQSEEEDRKHHQQQQQQQQEQSERSSRWGIKANKRTPHFSRSPPSYSPSASPTGGTSSHGSHQPPRPGSFKRSKSSAQTTTCRGQASGPPLLRRAATNPVSDYDMRRSPSNSPRAINPRRQQKQIQAREGSTAGSQQQQEGKGEGAQKEGGEGGGADAEIVHAFVDNTNTFSQVPRRTPDQMAKRLAVGERGRPLASRIVVGSARSHDALCTWVSRYAELGYLEVYMDVLGDGLGGKESVVDDTLHANITLTILRAELDDVMMSGGRPVSFASLLPRRVLLLYSGDSNENHGRVSFPECVELALACGWAVEVVHKMPNCTPQSYLRTQGEPWGKALTTLDMRRHTSSSAPGLPTLSSISSAGSISSVKLAAASAAGSMRPDEQQEGEEQEDEGAVSEEQGSGDDGYSPPPAASSLPPCPSVSDKLIADVEELNTTWTRLQAASREAEETLDDIRVRVERILRSLNNFVDKVKREKAAPAKREAFVVTEEVVQATKAYIVKSSQGRVLRNELRRQLRKTILPEGTYQNGCVDLVIEALEERGMAYLEGTGAKTEVVTFSGNMVVGGWRSNSSDGRQPSSRVLTRQQAMVFDPSDPSSCLYDGPVPSTRGSASNQQKD